MNIKEIKKSKRNKKDITGIFEYDILKQEIILNKKARKIFEPIAQDLKNPPSDFFKFIFEREPEKIKNALKEAFETGEFSECFSFLADKTEIYIYSEGKLFYNDNKIPVRIIGTIQDISKLKSYIERDLTNQYRELQDAELENNKHLLLNQDRFKILLESIPQMAWTALPNGQRNYFNQRWYQYTGQTYEEAKGDGWKKTQHPDDLASTIGEYKKLIEGKVYINEHRFKRASDGKWRWYLTRAIPIKNKEGKIELWIGTCTDIHDLKIAMDNLFKTRMELSHSNEELIHKNEQLIKINKDLDTFVYSASHDLKAPINNIEGLISMVASESDEYYPDRKPVFKKIEESIQRFKDTILELSKIGRNLQAISQDLEKVNFDTVFNEVQSDLIELIQTEKVYIKTDFTKAPEIDFSKRNLRSILYNLLSNAIKYRSFDRKAEVKITTEKADDKFIILSVKDNGLGITTEDIPKVFSMYGRIHTHIEGTGVGMAIVKRIIDNNEGKIEVESEVNKGTLFKIYFKQSESIR